MKRSRPAALLVCAAANIALYLFHYHRPSESGRFPSGALGQVLRYFTVYFGSTWVRHSSGWIALSAGAIGLCAALIFILCVVRQQNVSLLIVELVFLMLFCMATATVTAAGRWRLGTEEATASRYQAFALLFWCSLGLLLLFYGSRRRGWMTGISAGLLVMMLGFATQVRWPLIDAQWHQVQLTRISLALMTGVHDPSVLADAYPSAKVVLRDASYMKQNRLSIFHDDLYRQLGQPLNSVYRVATPDQCWGFVSSSQTLPADDDEGLRLTGYAWDGRRRRPARDVVATVDGRISGLGTSVTIPLKSHGDGIHADASRQGWIAFVRSSSFMGEARVQLYTLVGKSQRAACPFATVPW